MNSFSLKLSISFLAVCLFMLLATTVSAAQPYTVSPKLIDLGLEQRDIIERTVTVTNDGTGFLRIYPTVNEVLVDENGEIKRFEQVTGDDRQISITSWIEISRGRITLEPGESIEVPLTIRINPQAEAGEYHVFVGMVNAADKDAARRLARDGKADGVVVRIAVDQERTEFMKLDGFRVERFVTDPSENVMTLNMKNSGDAEIVPAGEVIFYDNRGYEVGTMPINTEQSEVASGDTFSLTSPIPEDLRAGKYKAFLSLEYGSDQMASLNDTTFFYVMPLSTMLMIFFSVLAFALLLTYLIHRKIRHAAVSSESNSVSMYLRDGTSESQDHDIDLKQK